MSYGFKTTLNENSNDRGGGTNTKVVVSVTHAALKALRDAGNLTPGAWYRITDYQCTTSQLNTRSAGHVFDIIVQATDESHLSEDAKAMLHDGDTYFKDCHLDQWKIKYCLDNDLERFSWACNGNRKSITIVKPGYEEYEYNFTLMFTFNGKDDPSEAYDAWIAVIDNTIQVALTTHNPSVGDGAVMSPVMIDTGQINSEKYYVYAINEDIVVPEGKGVVYDMTDDRGNRAGYDFKNIQFKTGVDDVVILTENTYYYTFNTEGIDGSVETPEGYCVNNKFGDFTRQIFISDSKKLVKAIETFIALSQNVMLGSLSLLPKDNIIGYPGTCRGAMFGVGCVGNVIKNSATGIRFGTECKENLLLSAESSSNVVFKAGCSQNTISGSTFYNINFGPYCKYNTIDVAEGVSDIIFGFDCGKNTFSGRYCSNINFGDNCYCNMMEEADDITLSDNCSRNTFGSGCKSITLGRYFEECTFGKGVDGFRADGYFVDENFFEVAYVRWMKVEDGTRGVELRPNCDTGWGRHYQYITIKANVSSLTSSGEGDMNNPTILTDDEWTEGDKRYMTVYEDEANYPAKYLGIERPFKPVNLRINHVAEVYDEQDSITFVKIAEEVEITFDAPEVYECTALSEMPEGYENYGYINEGYGGIRFVDINEKLEGGTIDVIFYYTTIRPVTVNIHYVDENWSEFDSETRTFDNEGKYDIYPNSANVPEGYVLVDNYDGQGSDNPLDIVGEGDHFVIQNTYGQLRYLDIYFSYIPQQ